MPVESETENFEHLKWVFGRLNEYGSNIKPNECNFGITSIDLLGHNIFKEGVKPSQKKVAAIKDFELPKSVQ